MTKRTRDVIYKVAMHAALLAGGVLFAFPFVWLVTTTFKGDEEVFSERMNWIPKIPHYSSTSPYLDQRAYDEMRPPTGRDKRGWWASEQMLRDRLWERAQELAPELGIDLPPEAQEQVARGLWVHVRDTLPADVTSKDALFNAAPDAATAEALQTVWNRISKRCLVGDLRLLTAGNEDLLTGRPDTKWELGSGELAADGMEVDGETGRLLTYEEPDERLQLLARADIDSDVERIALGLHDDESWRTVGVSVATPEGVYESARPFVMSNGEWQDVTWSFAPVRDRRSLEIPLVKTSEASAGEWKLVVDIHPTSPWKATFEKFIRNYREAVRYVPFWTFAKNSVLLVVLNILGQIFACSVVAFAFARLRWPGRDICFVLLLSTMMLPPQVTMVPVFLIVRKLGWYNTLTPLWMPSFFGSAFFIFLLRQFLMTIPRELEEAAKIDGCSYWGLYWRIMLPLIRPALAAVAIFQFLGSWNDFMGPLIYISDLRLTPLSLGLFQFQQEHAAEWGMLMAGSLIMTLPAILLFFFAQKYFIQGITLTGLKG